LHPISGISEATMERYFNVPTSHGILQQARYLTSHQIPDTIADASECIPRAFRYLTSHQIPDTIADASEYIPRTFRYLTSHQIPEIIAGNNKCFFA
jgi:uncharacterized protein YdaL